MPYYEINGATNCGHKVYGDWKHDTYDATTCERMILCEDVGNCIESGITTPLNCAEKAAVTAECEKDYIEFRATSSHCFCNPAGRVWPKAQSANEAAHNCGGETCAWHNVYPLVFEPSRLYHVSFLTIRSDWWGKKPEEVKVERYDDAADEWVPFDQDKEEGWVPKKPNGDDWDAAYYGLTSCANQPSNGEPQDRVGEPTLTGEEACRGHLNLKAVHDEDICGWPWQCCGGGFVYPGRFEHPDRPRRHHDEQAAAHLLYRRHESKRQRLHFGRHPSLRMLQRLRPHESGSAVGHL